MYFSNIDLPGGLSFLNAVVGVSIYYVAVSSPELWHQLRSQLRKKIIFNSNQDLSCGPLG
jgi:hypothetical protein